MDNTDFAFWTCVASAGVGVVLMLGGPTRIVLGIERWITRLNNAVDVFIKKLFIAVLVWGTVALVVYAGYRIFTSAIALAVFCGAGVVALAIFFRR